MSAFAGRRPSERSSNDAQALHFELAAAAILALGCRDIRSHAQMPRQHAAAAGDRTVAVKTQTVPIYKEYVGATQIGAGHRHPGRASMAT